MDKRDWRWKGDVGESYQVESVVAFQSAVHLVLPHKKRVEKSHQSVTWLQLSDSIHHAFETLLMWLWWVRVPTEHQVIKSIGQSDLTPDLRSNEDQWGQMWTNEGQEKHMSTNEYTAY